MAGSAVVKHVPQRTCIVCRQIRGKRELVRIVYTDRLEVDLSGKRPGRGAYLCRQQACWEGALAKGRLEHALRAKMTLTDKHTIEDYARTMTG
ncbi:MAG: YlxR family protein [Chloroflexota bacterium]